MKIARAALIGIVIFAYIPLTFYVYFIVVGLVYDVNWFNIKLIQLIPSFFFILAWLVFPIAFTAYLMKGRRALKK
ncbi:MAG: hypothetical protein Q8Q67_00485 [bacterium]|nr:hypothetical protein [bacterium]